MSKRGNTAAGAFTIFGIGFAVGLGGCGLGAALPYRSSIGVTLAMLGGAFFAVSVAGLIITGIIVLVIKVFDSLKK